MSGVERLTVQEYLQTARAAHVARDLYRARDAVLMAKAETPEGRDLVHVLFTSGVVLREIGDINAAITDLRACLEALPAYPDLQAVMAGMVHYNLGLALRQARRLEESVSAYGLAIHAFHDGAMFQQLCKALQNRAWVLCLVQDADGAQIDLAESRALCTTAENFAQQRIGEAFAAMLGNSEERQWALQECDRLVEPEANMPPDVVSHAYWLAGRVALETGAPHVAETMALQAIQTATVAGGENRCLLDASDLLRSVNLAKLNGGKTA